MFRWSGALDVAERLSEPAVHGRRVGGVVGGLIALCMVLTGLWALLAAAIATGIVLISIGLLLHFRYLWSSYETLAPFSEIGSNVAAAGAILGIGYGFYYFLFHR